MKTTIFIILTLLFTSCVSNQNIQEPKGVEVTHSWYLGKSLNSFTINNGLCYNFKEQDSGAGVCYYRSESPLQHATALFEDRDENDCELALHYDSQKIIRGIEVLNGMSDCAFILR